MTPEEVLAELESLGTAQNRKVYGRHGVSPPLFGVSYAHLGQLEKKVKTDHALAGALWESGVHDARVLACRVADTGQLNVALCNRWVKELQNYVLTDAFAGLIARSPLAEGRMKTWVKSRNEWIGSCGWGILSSLAIAEIDRANAFFTPYLEHIARNIHKAPNRTRHTMNNALIAIGCRNDALAKAATETAREIGPVIVDHGETNCKTPDAITYIEKTRAHYVAKCKPKHRKRC